MRLGLKLEIGFDHSNATQRLYGDREVLDHLVALGVESLEAPLGTSIDPDAVNDHVRRCHRAGLGVSFHPYTEGSDANLAHFTGPDSEPAHAHQRFFVMAARAAADQGDTVVNIHPAAAPSDIPRKLQLERSIEFFSWARRWCEEHTPRVHPVAELQLAPSRPDVIRIGDTPEELARVVEASGVGACWDVGHAVLNHRRFGSPELPDDGLWERIEHVHCHDVDRSDHLPPRHGPAPWRDFLSKLASTGFGGTVVVEVTSGTFIDHGGLESLEEAMAAVRSTFPPST